MDAIEQNLPTPLDWESFLQDLPEFDFHDFLQENDTVPVTVMDNNPSPNDPVLSEIQNLLMNHAENDTVVYPETPSSESEYFKLLLEEILVPPEEGPESQRSKTESEEASDKDRIDDTTSDETMSKKLKRQLRNRDAALKSRERKKLYVKNLEMKSRYLEGECRRLEHMLQCCYAENNTLRLCLQPHGTYGASMTMQESAVLLLGMYLETTATLLD